ncbi:outer membrane beta-barrel protein [Sphingomonas sp. G-3-2-10]|jgi:outer membrane immunogenic protein|uniref:outer membrane protein n=1 Tax=Sphingomonas sp. G-3-2-10 TaxID=2728838 RepID=UPI00146ABE43|nr:outer membrane beta-barrel protein [Sphingomonas sp. G-3-2-10]NML07603.1 porin family protein [Sphingomonas sp. G-3-2-10]
MRIALFAAALAASTALAAPAFAQETVDPTFTGPRVEGVVGWDRLDSGDTSGTEASDGVVYGGAIGYDIATGGAVFGVEGEITGSTNKQEGAGLIVPGDSFRVKAGRDLYAGVRVGFLAGPRTLIYAKGGYTNAAVETRYTSGLTTVTDSENIDGWRLGAGAEFNLANNIYLKGEYRYSNYSSLDGVDIDLDRHQVVAGLGVRF